VGQDAIEFVARALDVPLYRRVIGGTALAQDSEYGSRNAEERGGVNGDETEDLYALLSDVKVMKTLSINLLALLSIWYSLVSTS
jgi:diphthine-ammonia ligase